MKMPTFRLSVSFGSEPVLSATSCGGLYLYDGLTSVVDGADRDEAVTIRVRTVRSGRFGTPVLPASLTRSAKGSRFRRQLSMLVGSLPHNPLLFEVVAGRSGGTVVTGRNGWPHATPTLQMADKSSRPEYHGELRHPPRLAAS